MNILFFGSSDYSYECLKAVRKDHKIIGVVTQPDKQKRGNILEPPFLKEKILSEDIPIYQPENIKLETELIKKINPDLILTAAYGQILPKEMLEIPRYKSVNIHASLLPKYKGASPIRQVIINGEEYTGLTSIYMDEHVDTGNIILQEKIKITSEETFDSLYRKFLETIPNFTQKTIEYVLSGQKAIVQDFIENSYTSKVSIKDTQIDWNQTCLQIDRFIRAFYSAPATYFYLGDKKIKVYKAKPIDIYHENPAGKLIRIDKEFIRMSCKKGYIDIYELQLPGKRVMDTKDFINGNKAWLKEELWKSSY